MRVIGVLWVFRVFKVSKGLKGLRDLRGLKVFGVLKAEVVDENALRTIPGSDFVCVPNLVVDGLVLFAKNVNTQADRRLIL